MGATPVEKLDAITIGLLTRFTVAAFSPPTVERKAPDDAVPDGKGSDEDEDEDAGTASGTTADAPAATAGG